MQGSQSPHPPRITRRSSLESNGPNFFGYNASFETRASGFGLPERVSSHIDGSGSAAMEFESTSTFSSAGSSSIEAPEFPVSTTFDSIPTYSTSRVEPFSLRPISPRLQTDMELDPSLAAYPPIQKSLSSTPAFIPDTSYTRKEAFESLRLSHLAEGEGFINGLRHWESNRSSATIIPLYLLPEGHPPTLHHTETNIHEDTKDEEEIIVSIHMRNEDSLEAGVQEVSDKLSTGWGLENNIRG